MPPQQVNTWTEDRLTDRFRAVEGDVAELNGTVKAAIAKRDDVFTPQLSELRSDVRLLTQSVSLLHTDLQKIAVAIEARDVMITQERALNKRALWALTATLLVALIGAIATIIAAGIVK